MTSLAGVQAYRVDDRLEPGTYLMRKSQVERTNSSKNDPQIILDWRVDAGPFKGAEQRDWVTFWGDGALGNIVQLLDACQIPVPDQEFSDFGEMADWLAKKLEAFNGVVEAVVRQGDPYHKDGELKEGGPKIKGYRKPGPSSDVPDDSSGFAHGPTVASQDKPPF